MIVVRGRCSRFTVEVFCNNAFCCLSPVSLSRLWPILLRERQGVARCEGGPCGEAKNPGPAHAERRRRVGDNVFSTFLDGLEADLKNDVTQLSPTMPTNSGATERFVGWSFTPLGVECHRAASRRLVLVGSKHNEFSSARDTSGCEQHFRVFDRSNNSGSPDGKTSFHCLFLEQDSSRTEPMLRLWCQNLLEALTP